MSLIRQVGLCACVIAATAGCRASFAQSAWGPRPNVVAAAPVGRVEGVDPLELVTPLPAVVEASYQQPMLVNEHPAVLPGNVDSELSLTAFVGEVLARNPSLQAMVAAWQSAAERYPQAVALDDPMFMSIMAPASFDSDETAGSYMLDGSQKLPWFGKRRVRGASAQAEAGAAFQDVQDARLRLTEAAQVAFFDYYLVRRQQELNRRNIEVMREFRSSARSKYEANQVTQQDMLQADVELTQLSRRELELRRMELVAVARMNTLLHQPPCVPLSPPPAVLPAPEVTVDPCQLLQAAVARRPDLASLAAQISREQAEVELAAKQYYPDTEVFGRYDTFWEVPDQRGQVGLRMNMPIYFSRLRAATREAGYRVSQKQAEYDQKLLDVQFEVQQAYAQFEESRQALALYDQQLIPITEQNVSAARSNYDTGKASFLELATAQRQLIELREQQQEALATYHRRLAELERAVGGPLPAVAVPEEVPPYRKP